MRVSRAILQRFTTFGLLAVFPIALAVTGRSKGNFDRKEKGCAGLVEQLSTLILANKLVLTGSWLTPCRLPIPIAFILPVLISRFIGGIRAGPAKCIPNRRIAGAVLDTAFGGESMNKKAAWQHAYPFHNISQDWAGACS